MKKIIFIIILAFLFPSNSLIYSANKQPSLMAPAAPAEFSEPSPTPRLDRLRADFTKRLYRIKTCLRKDSTCSKSETLKAFRDVVVTIAALAALMYGAGHGFELIGKSLFESGYDELSVADRTKKITGAALQKTGAALKAPARAVVANAKNPFKRKNPLTIPLGDIVTYQGQEYYVIINDQRGKVGIALDPEARYFDWVSIADLDYFPTYETYK